MKIYIAAPYPIRVTAIEIMQALEANGHEVTSRWLRSIDEPCDEHARKDLADVAAADVLLAINPPGWENKGTGGRHVELGYALALNKHVILLGERTNSFHYLSHVCICNNTEAVVEWLKHPE